MTFGSSWTEATTLGAVDDWDSVRFVDTSTGTSTMVLGPVEVQDI